MACIELFNYLKNFQLGYSQQKSVYESFSEQLDKMYSKSEHLKAAVKCLTTGIYKLPNGDEKFSCLGLTIGYDFRCFLVDLNGCPEEATVSSAIISIPEEYHLTGEDDFFDHIIRGLCEFAKSQHVEKLFLPLGVTFDMPINHTGTLERNMNRLFKAFKYAGPERDEVNLLLTVSLAKNLELETCHFLIVNQATALLMMCMGLINANCRLVLTEWGAAFIETTEHLEFLTHEQKRKGPQTIIELDWSEFADGNILNDILSEFDGVGGKKYVFEKMIAGKHRCNMFQQIVLELIKKNVVFPAHADRLEFIKLLEEDGRFTIEELDLIEIDECPDFPYAKKIIKRVFGVSDATIDECFRLRHICQNLSKRASQMIAVVLSALLNRWDGNDMVVGLDKELYKLKERYPIIMDTMFMLVRPLLRYEIICINQDAGIAAALTVGKVIQH